MKVIHKQVLEVKDKQILLVPTGAEFLTAREQYGVPCLWYLCDDEANIEERTIVLHGTGHKVTEFGLLYIGSAMLMHGDLVFHVFEELK